MGIGLTAALLLINFGLMCVNAYKQNNIMILIVQVMAVIACSISLAIQLGF